MKTRLFAGIAVFSLLALNGCKKDKNTTIELTGTIYDGVTGQPVQGAVVALSCQQYQNGVISGAYTSLGTSTTSSGGAYSFSFDKPSTPQYKITISRSEYYSFAEEFNADQLHTSSSNTRNYALYPSATFVMGIKNQSPFNTQDKIIYQNLSESSSCSGCCDNTLKSFDGMNIDTSITCNRYGDRYIKFKWIVTKNSVNTTFTDSVFCPKGQTTSYQINY